MVQARGDDASSDQVSQRGVRELRRDDAHEEGLFGETRKVNAKKSQKDIAADEYVQPELKLGFESKRDRYNGFDANDYSRVVERYEAADAMKQKLAKQKELEKAFRRRIKKKPTRARKSRTIRARTTTTTPRWTIKPPWVSRTSSARCERRRRRLGNGAQLAHA